MKSIWLLIILVVAVATSWASGNNDVPAPMMEAAMSGEVYGADSVPPPTAMDGDYVKPADNELKKKLTPLQYTVTQHEGTEPSWNNIYWDDKEDGIYVDIVSGEPLFSSKDKYDSRTGWPSFTRPLHEGNIVEKKDSAYGMVRVEVRSFYGDSHLGHLFNDGPAPTGLRYCMNSASMRFVSVEDLESEGYGEYLSIFDTK